MDGLKPSKEHIANVKKQLKLAGVTGVGLLKMESRYLPHIIHENETIGGVIYGRQHGNSVMLVATDSRVIFLDRKPGYTNSEELTYDVVAGVTYNKQGSFASVTLHTRLGDFGMSFVNIRAADRFTEFVEKRRLEAERQDNGQKREKAKRTSDLPRNAKLDVSDEALRFLKEHDTGVLSSLDAHGKIHGAVVYYVVDDEGHLYFTTKSETQKAFAIRGNGQVAFTVYDAPNLQTIQLEGKAAVETEQSVKEWVFSSIVRPRFTTKGTKLPPVTTIKEGAFVIIRITPERATYRDFGADK